MAGMNRPWDLIGRIFLGVAVLVGLAWIFAKPIAPTGQNFPKTNLPDVALIKSPFAVATVFLSIFSGVATFLWMLIDIIDRRSKYIWILPLVPFGFFGLHAIPLGLYQLIGRLRSR